MEALNEECKTRGDGNKVLMQIVPDHGIATHVAPNASSVVQVESSKLLPHIFMCTAIAVLALALAVMAMIQANNAKIETRIFQEKVDQYKGELLAHGFHIPKEN